MTFSRLWLSLFLLGSLSLLLSAFGLVWITVTLGWYALLLALALTDLMLFPPLESLKVERDVEERLTAGTQIAVRLNVRSSSPVPLYLELRDSPPEVFQSDLTAPSIVLRLRPAFQQTITYHLTPRARGDYAFGDLYVRVRGRLGMMHRLGRIAATLPVKVYPNWSEAIHFDLASRRGRMQQTGFRRMRLQGPGGEFESLRDYLPDDEQRRIDWKATARRGKLVTRQYQAERSQCVLLALDVGRTMAAEIDGVRKLDYVINAALRLAAAATQADDRVGLLVFSDRVKTYLPPRKGHAQVYAILEALYNVEAGLDEPDYRGALAYLQARWRRRSLVVCFTDLWDPDSSRQTIAELAALQPRHLAAAVTLLDTPLLRAAEQAPVSAAAIYRKAVALQMLDDRHHANAALRQRGVLVIDAPADRLSAELISRYLEVKEKMQL